MNRVFFSFPLTILLLYHLFSTSNYCYIFDILLCCLNETSVSWRRRGLPFLSDIMHKRNGYTLLCISKTAICNDEIQINQLPRIKILKYRKIAPFFYFWIVKSSWTLKFIFINSILDKTNLFANLWLY